MQHCEFDPAIVQSGKHLLTINMRSSTVKGNEILFLF